MTASPHELLRKARESAGFHTAQAASKAHGWAQTTYANHESGRSWPPRDKALQQYAKAFGVSVSELLGKKAENVTIQGIPHLSIGNLSKNSEEPMRGNMPPAPLPAPAQPFEFNPETTFTISNPDKAMTDPARPHLFQEDVLCFDRKPNKPPVAGDYVLAYVKDHGPVFRIYSPARAGGFRLLALNPAVEPIVIAAGEKGSHIIGKLVFFSRGAERLP